ncbi:MAG: 2-C-methyl-D-erythritol 2,4-cyclodiphosphate synthase [Defluviitaleaceae bacterium]|nr:2-C-methyl-D-erythritol 2,4-cyclodiphosphate synthase [Defluviitaleaceae bacterium]
MQHQYQSQYQIGTGYDVHRLVANRKLILGGVDIPHSLGLLGHSDADVLTHAVMDALLGAAGLGDIGQHFPDNNVAYKDASSLCMLLEVGKLIAKDNWQVANIDTTLICQAPKLSPYRDHMKHNIAQALDIQPTAVNVKFTTEEGLGFTGTMQGIAAQAVCLINKSQPA